jgi:hypothetical protein
MPTVRCFKAGFGSGVAVAVGSGAGVGGTGVTVGSDVAVGGTAVGSGAGVAAVQAVANRLKINPASINLPTIFDISCLLSSDLESRRMLGFASRNVPTHNNCYTNSELLTQRHLRVPERIDNTFVTAHGCDGAK